MLGHDAVSILNGGHALWAKEGRALNSGVVKREPTRFQVRFQPQLVATQDDVVQVANGEHEAMLIDNRPPAQFIGKEKHPEASRFGALPTAVNLPQSEFFDESNGRFAPLDRLSTLWAQAGADDSVEQITYCNTGHWASLGWFTASELMGRNARLYDGSMVEWAAREELPMVHIP